MEPAWFRREIEGKGKVSGLQTERRPFKRTASERDWKVAERQLEKAL